MIELPDDPDITEIDLSGNDLTVCPDLSRYTKLIKLDIGYNELTKLDNLPPNLKILDCYENKIKELQI